MATYRNDNAVNVDTFATYAEGKVSGKVGMIKPSVESIEAVSLEGALKIVTGPEAGRYVKKAGFVLVTTPPPPPAPSNGLPAYFTAHDANGNPLARYEKQ